MQWQFYWPNWWRLWPTYSEFYTGAFSRARRWVFTFGPLQIMGWVKRDWSQQGELK